MTILLHRLVRSGGVRRSLRRRWNLLQPIGRSARVRGELSLGPLDARIPPTQLQRLRRRRRWARRGAGEAREEPRFGRAQGRLVRDETKWNIDTSPISKITLPKLFCGISTFSFFSSFPKDDNLDELMSTVCVARVRGWAGVGACSAEGVSGSWGYM